MTHQPVVKDDGQPKACPRHLIVSVPVSKKVFVECANKQKGAAATKVCAHACIGCGLCVKECKFDAIHVVDNVAVVDYAKCKNCKMCTKVCPKDAIAPIPTKEEKEKYKAMKKAQAEKKAAAAKAAAEAKAAEEAAELDAADAYRTAARRCCNTALRPFLERLAADETLHAECLQQLIHMAGCCR